MLKRTEVTMTYQSIKPHSKLAQPLSYINQYPDSGEALSILRRKIDSLTIVFEGLAVGSNWNQSALDGVWLLLRDIQQHVAMLDEQ
jgi:hypothetical protein